MPRFNPQLPLADNPVFRIRVHGRIYDQTTINRFDVAADWPGGSTGDSLLNFWPQLSDTWRPLVCPEWTMEYITSELLQDPATPLATYDDDVNDQGTHAGVALPAIVAVNFTRRTGVRGQRGVGSVRLAGVPVTAVEGNEFTAAYRVKMETFAVDLQGTLNSVAAPGQKYRFVIANYGAVNADTGLRVVRAAAISGTFPDYRVSSQRTRKPRRDL